MTHLAATIAAWAVTAYLVLLATRWAVDFTVALERRMRVPRVLALPLEALYTATDPPLKLVRRHVPPLRILGVSFDLGFLLLVLVTTVIQGRLWGLA